MSSSDILKEQIFALETLLQDIQDTIDLLVEEAETPKAAAENLRSLNDAKRELAAAYKDYEATSVPYFQNPLTLADGTTLEARWSTSRRQWDHRGMAEKVANRIVDESFDFETGEMLRGFDEMVEELLKYAGIGYWKKSVEDLGLDLDDYSASETKQSVSIRRPK